MLDATQVMAGPYCAMVLADLGATVIKVEPPAGDSTRQMPGASGTDSPSLNAVNRGKRSTVRNLRPPAGREVFTRRAPSPASALEDTRPAARTSRGSSSRRMSAAAATANGWSGC